MNKQTNRNQQINTCILYIYITSIPPLVSLSRHPRNTVGSTGPVSSASVVLLAPEQRLGHGADHLHGLGGLLGLQDGLQPAGATAKSRGHERRVGGSPTRKKKSSVMMKFSIYGKIRKNVLNHQSEDV